MRIFGLNGLLKVVALLPDPVGEDILAYSLNGCLSLCSAFMRTGYDGTRSEDAINKKLNNYFVFSSILYIKLELELYVQLCFVCVFVFDV